MNRVQGMIAVAGLSLAVCAAGCGGDSQPTETVVLDSLEALKDGEFKAWKLDPGTYKVELTASGDGAAVKWVGSTCPGADETAEYSVTCEMKQTGQLIIENPTGFGIGATTTVTVKVTQIDAQE